MPQLKIKRLSEDAVIPKYATPGAACFDLHCTNDGAVPSGSCTVFNTGLAFEVPEGYVMKIYSRSSHGFKSGIRLANVVGIIDSDYRGEVLVKLHNDSGFHFQVAKGERIAQAMLEVVEQVSFEEVEQLSSTERGIGGFGSTGK